MGDQEIISDSGETDGESFSWESSEYVHHERNRLWYVVYISASALIAIVIFLITRDIFSSLTLVLMSGGLLFMVRQKPQNRKYTISEDGIEVDGRFFDFERFRSFSIVPEGDIFLLSMRPVRRFDLAIEAYFVEDQGESIFNILKDYLPQETKNESVVTNIIHRMKL